MTDDAASDPKSAVFARHRFDEGTLICPGDFHVTTIFSARVKEGEFAPNMVVTRDRLRPQESAETYVGRQLVELARKLKKFRLHGRKQITVAGLPATQLMCGWMGTQGVVEQVVTMVVRTDHALTFTTSAPKARSEELKPMFEEILASVVLKAEPHDP